MGFLYSPCVAKFGLGPNAAFPPFHDPAVDVERIIDRYMVVEADLQTAGQPGLARCCYSFRHSLIEHSRDDPPVDYSRETLVLDARPPRGTGRAIAADHKLQTEAMPVLSSAGETTRLGLGLDRSMYSHPEYLVIVITPVLSGGKGSRKILLCKYRRRVGGDPG